MSPSMIDVVIRVCCVLSFLLSPVLSITAAASPARHVSYQGGPTETSIDTTTVIQTPTETTPPATSRPISANTATQTTAATPSLNVGDYAVLGLNSVWLRQGSDLHSGHIGVQNVSPGPMLDSEAEISISQNVTFHNPASALAGDTVKLKQNSQVFDIFYNELDLGQNTTYGQLITPLSLPLVTNLPALPEITPGSTDVTLAKNESLELPAGAYGQITLKQKAELILTGGVYQHHRQRLDPALGFR